MRTAKRSKLLRSTSPIFPWLAACLLATLLTPGFAEAGEHRLGVGAHFWRTVDDISDDIFDSPFDGIEDDGFAWVVSYQYVPKGLFRFELDVEYYDGGFAGSPDSAYTPTGFVLFGGNFYAGVGIGFTVSNGLEDDVSDPFYAARLGWELDLLPGISVDINANYRAEAFNDLDEASSDAITLGAILRFNI